VSCGGLKTGDAGDDAEDDAGRVGDGDGQIARRFEQSVNHPQRAVNRGAKRLDGAGFMSGEILLNLENIGCVHTDCGNGGNYGQNTDLFVVHKYSSCKWCFRVIFLFMDVCGVQNAMGFFNLILHGFLPDMASLFHLDIPRHF